MHYSLTPNILWGDLFGKPAGQKAFDWNNEVFLFSMGRIALLNGVRLLAAGNKEKREVLVPAYICEETLWPLRDAGFSIRYYAVDDQFKFQFSELEDKISHATLAILAVHYFGIPQKLTGLKELCAKKKVFLIEDCAHAFCGKDSEIQLGSQGDISFFSIRKFLPVPDGGALLINNPVLQRKKSLIQIAANRKKTKYFKLVIRSLLNCFNLRLPKMRSHSPSNIQELCPRADIDQEKRGFVENESISRLSTRILARCDHNNLAQKRKNNYNQLADILKNIKGVHLPYPLADNGWSPYVLPVYVKKERQTKIIAGLKNNGIHVSDWPMLPVDCDGNEASRERMQRILLFPVHQNISGHGVQKMGEIAASALAGAEE